MMYNLASLGLSCLCVGEISTPPSWVAAWTEAWRRTAG